MTNLKEIYKEHRIVVLPKYSKLTEYLIWQFDGVLDAVPPGELRDSILEVYQRFLIKEHEFLPVDFKTLASNLYILIDFLTLAEKEMNKKPEDDDEEDSD